jgi:hypothetical protein
MRKNLINKWRQKQDGFKRPRLQTSFLTVSIWRLKKPGCTDKINTTQTKRNSINLLFLGLRIKEHSNRLNPINILIYAPYKTHFAFMSKFF